MSKTRSVGVPLVVVCLTLISVAAAPVQAQPWSSELADLTPVQVHKRPAASAPATAEEALALTPAELHAPLPQEILQQAGERAVDYESFLTTYLPAPQAKALVERARGRGLSAASELPRGVQLAWHDFDPSDRAARTAPGLVGTVSDQPVPNLYLAQFAYPVQEDWLAALESCGVERIGFFQHRTFLVRADSPDQITGCSVSPYLSWVDSYRASDRISPSLLEEGSGEYTLQFVHGTDLSAKSAGLPDGIEVVDTYVSDQDEVAYLYVVAPVDALVQIVDTDPDLLSVSRTGQPGLSDERQGLIVAGIHNNTRVYLPSDGPTVFQHYRSWLSNRNLLTLSDQQHDQIVAIVDLGYDDGTAPSTQVTHHPDLESPERMDGLVRYSGDGTTPDDPYGHGTMVAGIIAGDGDPAAGGYGGADDGLYQGTGIAPGAKLFFGKFAKTALDNPNQQEDVLADSRNYSNGADRALIMNQSWNSNAGDLAYALPEYSSIARFFDARVLDANVERAGAQPMSVVFSAGNFADLCGKGVKWDTVSSPATAKNVISVGATNSYLLTPPPLSCRPCSSGDAQDYGRPEEFAANHIGRLAPFSSRGAYFGPGSSDPKVQWTRIKPDLVAPGNRVYSTVPFDWRRYTSTTLVNGCTPFYPTGQYYTYGAGTSFAAPVVSGVAALAREWFYDRGTDPSPSLVKAALIATADDLPGQTIDGGVYSGDHRPSPLYGWGRVNLDRLTNGVSKWYKSDSASLAVGTGQTRTWTKKVTAGWRDTFIVLAWSDDPASVAGHSQAALVNDLSLQVNYGAFKGNFFNEIFGNDDGFSYQFSVGAGGQDTINTVEAVFIPRNTYSSGQSISITVTGENVSRTGGQPFAVYAYNVN